MKKPTRGGINKFHKFSHSLKGKGYSMQEIGKMYKERNRDKKVKFALDNTFLDNTSFDNTSKEIIDGIIFEEFSYPV